jgi:CRP-like cAMP-binding protein
VPQFNENRLAVMDSIRQYFERTTHLSDEEWKMFSSKLERVVFPRKALILKEGQRELYLSFVEKGILRYFFAGEENDLTFAFSFQDEFASAYDSFVTQTPSEYCIQALTETILWRISYADLQQVYAETSVGERIGRFAAEQLYLQKSNREHSLLRDTAEQRYLKLFSEQPLLMKHIPMKYLASYIGITPQALSRIRARIS